VSHYTLLPTFVIITILYEASIKDLSRLYQDPMKTVLGTLDSIWR
jgi:hypothetical protein